MGRRDLQVHRRRPVVEEHGPAGVEADRPGDRRSGGLQRRARGGPRRSVGRRRRARRLQDQRRRAQLEAHAARRRRDRRHRAGDRPDQQQGPLCCHLSAAAGAVGHERRRRRQRHLEVDGRRRDVDEDRERHPGRAEGAHRDGRLSRQSQRALRPGRARHRERRLPHRRRRRDLAQAERGQPAADVLQPDPHRSADRLADLRPRGAAARLRRRRPHLPRRRRRPDPRRLPRDVDQPAQPPAPDPRRRRRRQPLLRPFGHLDVSAQPGAGPGVSRGLRHAVAVSRVRRPAGQQHVVRPERGAHQLGHRQRRLVRRPGRRRLPAADGSDRPAGHLRRVAGRPDEPGRPHHQRADGGPTGAARGQGRRAQPVPLQLGHGDAALAARPLDHLHRRAHADEVERQGPILRPDQPRPVDQHQTRDACRS